MAIALFPFCAGFMCQQQEQGGQVFRTYITAAQHRLLKPGDVEVVGKVYTFPADNRYRNAQVNTKGKADVGTGCIEVAYTYLRAGGYADRYRPGKAGVGINVERFGITAERRVKHKIQHNNTAGGRRADTHVDTYKGRCTPVNGSQYGFKIGM